MSTPSLITRFTRWVHTLPVSPRTFYFGLFLFGLLYGLLANWVAGLLPAGGWTFEDVYNTFSGPTIAVLILAFYSYYDTELAEAVQQSRSISGLKDEEFARVKHQLVIIPLWPHMLIGLLASAASIQAGMVEEGFSEIRLSYIPALLGGWAIAAYTTFGFAFRVIRLITLSVNFYSSPIRINLYNLPPIYELSTAVSKAGLFLLLIWYFNLPFNINEFFLESPAVLATAVLVALVPLASFLIPQLILNRRLFRTKRDLAVDVSLQLESVFKKLKAEIEADRMEKVGPLQAAIDTLISEKRFIESIPTWPWRIGTFRVAVTAVILPVLVWLIQQVLDRFLVF